jgi:Streptomyces sporulation and cell division protein, SsgA
MRNVTSSSARLPGPSEIKVGHTMNSSTTISAELGFRLVVPQQTIVPLVASLLYTCEDPYAIRIAFHVGLDEPVEWIFARELLSRGMESREGHGDVQVWPASESADGAHAKVLNIELASPFGQAHFEAPIAEVSDFLQRTYRVVPEGREGEHVDVEAELTDLLRQA